MGIVQDLTSQESDVREAVDRAVSAELSGEEVCDSGPEQNHHFEVRCGQGDDEVYVYVERLDYTEGIEIMLWADESYFEDCDEERPSIEDGGEELKEFTDTLFNIVMDELDGTHVVNIEYHGTAPPSVVFFDSFYL